MRKASVAIAAVPLAVAGAALALGRDRRPATPLRLARSAEANRDARATADAAVDAMTLGERVALMTPHSPSALAWVAEFLRAGLRYNHRPYYAAGDRARGLPSVRFADGPRGVVCGESTCFPVAIARAASWDPLLEREVGEAIGREVRAHGGNYFGGVCVNLLRHPAGGRAQEGYGEDPFLVGAMGSALVRGVQRHNVIACVKHYALNNQENARFEIDVYVSERVLREVYLPHFRDCVVGAGAASVMGAYNRVRGEQACESRHLLTTILRDDWGFDGFTISDFLRGVRDTARAATAGLDIEMPAVAHYGRRLRRAVERGRVPAAAVEASARRVARTVLDFETRPDPEPDYSPSLIACERHRALTRRAAERGMVLLRNKADVLPLDPDRVRHVLVVGPRADAANVGDHGSSRVRPPYTTTPLTGLRAEYGDRVAFAYDPGRDVAACAVLAQAADAVVAVVGYDHDDEGEYIFGTWGGDRASLRLARHEEELLRALGAANPRTAAVLIGGSAIVCEAWRREVPAIVMAFYPGMEGGAAIARTLFGDNVPGGKLPFTVPTDEAHLPDFDRDARHVTYDRWHGYARLQRDGHAPAFAFGHGLSYTRFEVTAVGVRAGGADIDVRVEVRNVGARDGDEVVQVYVAVPGSAVEREPLGLRGFRRVGVGAGQAAEVEIAIERARLRYYDARRGAWVFEDADYEIWVGTSSDRVERASVLRLRNEEPATEQRSDDHTQDEDS